MAHEQHQRAQHPPENTAEDLRPPGQQRGRPSPQDRLDIRSYIDTARKHGKNAMDVIHDLMLGRPWRPPVQAFSP